MLADSMNYDGQVKENSAREVEEPEINKKACRVCLFSINHNLANKLSGEVPRKNSARCYRNTIPIKASRFRKDAK